MTIKSHVVFLNVGEEIICTKDLSYFNELIVVVFSLEERLLLEDHTSKHASERPDVEGVIVHLQVNEELRSLEVSTSDTYVVFLARVIEFSKTPINKTELTAGVINHNVVRLNISVHDAVRVGVLERLQNFEGIKSNVHRVELVVELLRLNVWDVFKDKARGLGRTVT